MPGPRHPTQQRHDPDHAGFRPLQACSSRLSPIETASRPDSNTTATASASGSASATAASRRATPRRSQEDSKPVFHSRQFTQFSATIYPATFTQVLPIRARLIQSRSTKRHSAAISPKLIRQHQPHPTPHLKRQIQQPQSDRSFTPQSNAWPTAAEARRY